MKTSFKVLYSGLGILFVIIGAVLWFGLYHTKTTGNSVLATTYKGIYVATPQISASSSHMLATSTYALPYIDGIAIRIGWNSIEPNNTTYNWSVLDSMITIALQNHKKLSIAVGTGNMTPSWVYTQGVPKLTFSTLNNNGTTCSTLTEPIPWDTTYQGDYASMMTALSAHLHAIPGAYDALTVMKITGMNEQTEELHLSDAVPGKNAPACESNGTKEWQAAGYQPSKVITAWGSFATAVHNAFPDKELAQIIVGNGFPSIDESGALVATSSPSYVDVTQTVLTEGLSRFGSHFGGLFDALSVEIFSSQAQEVENIAQKGGIAFYQTNFFGGPTTGSQCGLTETHRNKEDATVCTTATYQQLLQNGINHHGTYFEIWEPNAIAFPIAVKAAGVEL